MAISKKSLGKVLAISMASAMAMSSLSAALVSVSAVSDPALASNGNVGFKDALMDGEGNVTADSAEDVITEYFHDMSDINDDVVDVMAGEKINLLTANTGLSALLDKSAGFTYTDSDGLEVPLTSVEYEYKVTSGTSYLKYYSKNEKEFSKGDLVAQTDKSGSATLQIKITGYADIGAGRDDKKVTMTQNIKFDIHKNNEINLEAYKVADADEVDFSKRPLTDADLNDLAAYGSDITFCVVQYTDANGFFATIDPVKGGTYSAGDNNTPKQQQTLIEQAITDKLTEQLGKKDGLASDKTIDNLINVIKTKNALTWDSEANAYTLNWDAIKGEQIQEEVKQGDAKYQPNTPGVPEALEKGLQGKTSYKVGNTVYVPTSDTATDNLKVDGTDAVVYKQDKTTEVSLLVPKASPAKAVEAVKAPVVVTKKDAKKLTVDTSDEKMAKALSDAYTAAKQESTVPAAWQVIELADDGNYYYTGDSDSYDATSLKVNISSGKTYAKTDAAVKTALNSALDTAFGSKVATYVASGTNEWALTAFDATVSGDLTKFAVKPETDDGVAADKTVYNLNTTAQNILVGGTQENETYTVIANLKEGTTLKLTDAASRATDANKTLVDTALKNLDSTKFVSITTGEGQTATTTYYYIGDSKDQATELAKVTAAIGTDSAAEAILEADTNNTDKTQLNLDGTTPVAVDEANLRKGYALTFVENVDVPGSEKSAFSAIDTTTTELTQKSATDAYHAVLPTEEVVQVYELKFQENVPDATSSYSAKTVEQVITEAELNQILKEAKTADTSNLPAEEEAVKAAFVESNLDNITGIRFYAGSGQDLFKVTDAEGGEWVRGTKGGDKGRERLTNGRITLSTKGDVGSGSIKVAVKRGTTSTDELVLNVKTVKAVDFNGASSITIDKSGSKTIVDEGKNAIVSNENINGFEIRGADSVIVDNGNVGCIKDATSIAISGGKAASIDADDDAIVTVTEDGVVGDILNAKTVTVDEGGQVGNITADADVSLTEGTIASIDVDGTVDIKGGTVTGNITATGTIDISSNEDDTNDDPLHTQIGGNITLLAKGGDSRIMINNESDDGAAKLEIRGNIVAKHVNTDGNSDDATITIGDSNTTGLIEIGGSVEGEIIQLGGNGLVSLAGVRAANEISRNDDDAETIESTIVFDGFNSTIAAINNFADVKVTEGTVIVNGAVNTTNLTVNSDAQIVADSIAVEEDIIEGGSIVVPVGKLTVTGSVDDAPSLAFTGELVEGAVAFVGNRGLVDKFETGGITLKAEKLANGNYNYLINKIELNGLTAIGKDVATGVKQEKNVSVALDGALPEGASIVWESDDADIATVTGNGTSAVITGEDVGTTTVTAKIVDANGRELGYEDASFDVNVLDNATVDSIGGDIGPDENQVDLDTKKKNMEAGQVYTFMVRGNNDVENISVTSGDTNVATVALANGADSRGALYNITAVADGKTDITVTYQGKTSKIAVKVGGFQLDTSSKKMAPGQVYSVLAKNVPADQAGNVTLAYDSNIVDVVKVNDNYNGRGVLFNVTAKAIGETEVKATYNNETETMAVNVVENTGRLTLDTASYTMPFAGNYTIGVKVEKNGRELTGEEVRAMITSGELVVSDSRTGSIVTTEVQTNGNVRVTGRQNEGTTYVQFIVMQNGQRVTHASVGVTVQNGATAGGSSVRSISQW